jgi:hypothetical protein
VRKNSICGLAEVLSPQITKRLAKSARCHICGRSAMDRDSNKLFNSANLRFAELICGQPTFGHLLTSWIYCPTCTPAQRLQSIRSNPLFVSSNIDQEELFSSLHILKKKRHRFKHNLLFLIERYFNLIFINTGKYIQLTSVRMKQREPSCLLFKIE